jgi:hypothetical protein
MNNRLSAAFFVAGIVMLLLGVLLYLTGWYFYYGLWAVAIGAVLVLITNKRWLTKGLVAGIPVLLVCWLFAQSFGPSQTFLLPIGYTGTLTVVHGEPCGQPDRKEDGRYIIEVPENGVAIIQRKSEGGWVDDKYYYVDKAGRRTPVANWIPHVVEPVFPRACLGGSGTSQYRDHEEIHYSDHYVQSTPSDTLKEIDFEARGHLMDSVVQECRESRE